MSIDDFRKKVNKLPQTVKEVLLSNETAKKVSNINDRYKLNPEQRVKTAQIIGKALVKDIPLNELINNIKTQLNLETKKVELLTFEIIQTFFLPLKQYFPNSEILIKKSQPKTSIPESSTNVVNLKEKQERSKEEKTREAEKE